MDILQLLVIALVQGITEFLPISSSAHLILIPVVTGWADQGLAIDVAAHIGTLAAVILYFRRDVGRLAAGAWDAALRRRTAETRLLVQIAVATIPVIVAGFVLKDMIATDMRSPLLIAATTAGFGLLLFAADRRADDARGGIESLSWTAVLLIGLAQALALVPGVSRSGITMTAALFLGLRRTDAARFSLLLSIPTTAAAGTLGADLWQSGDAALQTDALVVAVFAFASAFVAIAGLMAWLRKASFLPFVVYRLVLATILVGLIVIGVLQPH
jgi:undecaprenyl-diphosphatase